MARLEGDVVEYALWFDFSITNNEIEYEALIARLKRLQMEFDTSPYLEIFN